MAICIRDRGDAPIPVLLPVLSFLQLDNQFVYRIRISALG